VGFPAAGFEVQVANSYKGDNKKTGSLYAVRNVAKQLVPDNAWFTMRIAVRGKDVQIWVRLATNLGPPSEVNSGPRVEA
jgi:hypothetical protein